MSQNKFVSRGGGGGQLLQNEAKVYYELCQVFHCKMRKLLQNMSILLQNAAIIIKCDIYYKMRWYSIIGSKKLWYIVNI